MKRIFFIIEYILFQLFFYYLTIKILIVLRCFCFVVIIILTTLPNFDCLIYATSDHVRMWFMHIWTGEMGKKLVCYLGSEKLLTYPKKYRNVDEHEVFLYIVYS